MGFAGRTLASLLMTLAASALACSSSSKNTTDNGGGGGVQSGGASGGSVGGAGSGGSGGSVGGSSGVAGCAGAQTYYLDGDGDGYGDPSNGMALCAATSSYVLDHTDCNDSAKNIHPGVLEKCDGHGIDDDCVPTLDGCPNLCNKPCGEYEYAGVGYVFCPPCSSGLPSWYSAKFACDNIGLKQVRIDDANENDFIKSTWVLFNGGGNVWIGGSDVTTEGDWLWEDGAHFWSGGACASYCNFYNGVPSADPDSDCLALAPNGFWYSEHCDSQSNHGFACENY